MQRYDNWLADNSMPRVLDEVALLVPNGGHASALIQALVKEPGFEYFNAARDKVFTWPFHTWYDVQYHFVRTPWHYRLEIMHPVSEHANGFSPLHAAMWRPHGSPENHGGPKSYPVVHLSYKVADERAYSQDKVDLAEAGATAAQYCTSTYGEFSYWLPDVAKELVWLKPRVNTRDAGL